MRLYDHLILLIPKYYNPNSVQVETPWVNWCTVRSGKKAFLLSVTVYTEMFEAHDVKSMKKCVLYVAVFSQEQRQEKKDQARE